MLEGIAPLIALVAQMVEKNSRSCSANAGDEQRSTAVCSVYVWGYGQHAKLRAHDKRPKGSDPEQNSA